MGVIVNKNDQLNNELSRRINADLWAKAQNSGMAGGAEGNGVDEPETPDFAEGSEYVKHMKKTSKFGWVWVVLIILAIGGVIAIVMI